MIVNCEERRLKVSVLYLMGSPMWRIIGFGILSFFDFYAWGSFQFGLISFSWLEFIREGNRTSLGFIRSIKVQTP